MASLYSDLGKKADDLLKDGFPADDKNSLETEVNAKNDSGSKVQFLASRQKDGSLLAYFKPTIVTDTFHDVKGEFKVSLSTDNKSKFNASFNSNSLAGLKIKAGTTDNNVEGGFDYLSNSLATNFDLRIPLPSASVAPSLEAAAVFAHGDFSLGSHLSYTLNGKDAPEIEAKFQKKCSASTSVLSIHRSKSLLLGYSYFHQISSSRSLAAKFQFSPGFGSGTFLDGTELSVVGTNQVSDSTLVKARLNTRRATVAFGASTVVNSYLTVEAGTELPANGGPGSFYHLKFIYNN